MVLHGIDRFAHIQRGGIFTQFSGLSVQVPVRGEPADAVIPPPIPATLCPPWTRHGCLTSPPTNSTAGATPTRPSSGTNQCRSRCRRPRAGKVRAWPCEADRGVDVLSAASSGLAREVVAGHYLGTGVVANAFTVAFTIPNLFRKLLGEGALSAAFIPLYAQALKRGTTETGEPAGRVRRRERQPAGVILLGITLVGER